MTLFITSTSLLLICFTFCSDSFHRFIFVFTEYIFFSNGATVTSFLCNTYQGFNFIILPLFCIMFLISYNPMNIGNDEVRTLRLEIVYIMFF